MTRRWLAAVICLTGGLLCGCTHNVANVRTFASSVQLVTNDTPGIVLADEVNCRENRALQDEFRELLGGSVSIASLPCERLAEVGTSILVENKALQSYAAALTSIAQDEFATVDTDGDKVAATLRGSRVVAEPVVFAVEKIFSVVETATLSGYRQRELGKVMTGDSAAAFKTVMNSYLELVAQYSQAVDLRIRDLGLIRLDLAHASNTHDFPKSEPLAYREMLVRLSAIESDLNAKVAAIKEFGDAVAKVNPAFDAAVKDLKHPRPGEIYDDVKAFASQVKDAHDKLRKAFG